MSLILKGRGGGGQGLLVLGSSILLSMKVPPLLFSTEGPWGLQELSLFGLIGMILTLLLGLRVLWSIRKSGHLDSEDG